MTLNVKTFGSSYCGAITSYPAELLKECDAAANFDLQKVRQQIGMLPVFEIKHSKPEEAENRASVWWALQGYAKQQDLIKKTQLCRG